ncbi:MAG TPA: response regulator transcription factor [Gemmatimonadaceae bacterium]|nr:response regulator transcription factor [Gemmatimonadaceae bacterium]
MMGDATPGSMRSFAPAPRIRVVLADDHAVIREGLKLLVNAQPDMEVIGEAVDGEMALRVACELTPDVIVMDLSMPVLGGAAAAERVRRECPVVKVLALTVHEDRSYLAQLLKAGATGYILKRAAPEELVHAVRAVAAGGTYIDPAMAPALVQGYLQSRRRLRATAHEVLSERERDVLVRIARGNSNKEIARDLGLSVKTVETYKARFTEKLGVRSRVEIARYAAEHRLLDDELDTSAP